eukprot:scaffold114696_cov18-Tisochrysis_lutea.AAC.3
MNGSQSETQEKALQFKLPSMREHKYLCTHATRLEYSPQRLLICYAPVTLGKWGSNLQGNRISPRFNPFAKAPSGWSSIQCQVKYWGPHSDLELKIGHTGKFAFPVKLRQGKQRSGRLVYYTYFWSTAMHRMT